MPLSSRWLRVEPVGPLETLEGHFVGMRCKLPYRLNGPFLPQSLSYFLFSGYPTSVNEKPLWNETPATPCDVFRLCDIEVGATIV